MFVNKKGNLLKIFPKKRGGVMKKNKVIWLALALFLVRFGGVNATACQVISVERIDKGSFRIQLDLTDLPEGKFFWKGTTFPGAVWQFAKEVDNVTAIADGDIGTVIITHWPEGEKVLSFPMAEANGQRMFLVG